jgi:hypothetical protein
MGLASAWHTGRRYPMTLIAQIAPRSPSPNPSNREIRLAQLALDTAAITALYYLDMNRTRERWRALAYIWNTALSGGTPVPRQSKSRELGIFCSHWQRIRLRADAGQTPALFYVGGAAS